MDPRLATSLEGRYTITREVGAGGMATVYLAHDLKHDREVALKVLQPELGAVLGVERFLAEIKTTAKLQHPHILPLLDSGEAGGLLFYVMPYVAGESLRARLERERVLPIPEAVRIAREVASALDYAHRHRVIHRDIKPENILLHDGQALVADFGIALAVQSAGGQRMTQTGLSLGTPQYMSPEQALGEKVVDARSDLYSLAAVTYEMLTGDAPFTGSSIQAIVARVLNERPTPLHTLRDTVPPAVEEAVLTGLAKLPADRFASAKEFAAALDGAGAPGSVTRSQVLGAPPRVQGRLRDPVVLALGSIALVASAAAATLWSRRDRAYMDAVIRVPVEIPRYISTGAPLGSPVAISADGRTVAYLGGAANAATQQILVRSLDEPRSRAIPGTDFSQSIAVSPDGKSVLGWVKGRLIRTDIAGGAAVFTSEVSAFGGATWVRPGVIVVSNLGRLHTLADSGGQLMPLPGESDSGEVRPVALGDGETVLYVSAPGDGQGTRASLMAASVTTGRRTNLGVQGTYALGVVDGFLIYTTPSAQLMAVPFDDRALRTRGEPTFIGTVSLSLGRSPAVALSPTGTFAYAGGSRVATLVRVDSRGSVTPILEEPRDYGYPRLSPDGRRIAVTIAEAAARELWVYDVLARTRTKVSDTVGAERPEWTADGKDVVYRAGLAAGTALWRRPADLSAGPALLFPNPVSSLWEGVPTADGRGVVVQRDGAGARNPTASDVMYYSLTNPTDTFAIAATVMEETQPRPSPDGRWVAFQQGAAGGTTQVVVKPLRAGPGAQVVVSTGFGTEPVWARDGRRLYYRDGQQFIEVAYTATTDFRIVSRTPLFADGYLFAAAPHANYDVLPDGSGFIALRPVEGANLIVAHNWRAELRRLIAADGAR